MPRLARTSVDAPIGCDQVLCLPSKDRSELDAIWKATRREYIAANPAIFAVESTAEEMHQVAYAAPACRRGCPLSNRR